MRRAETFACIAEARMIETLQFGAPRMPYLTLGDEIRIEMFDPGGEGSVWPDSADRLSSGLETVESMRF